MRITYIMQANVYFSSFIWELANKIYSFFQKRMLNSASGKVLIYMRIFESWKFHQEFLTSVI